MAQIGETRRIIRVVPVREPAPTPSQPAPIKEPAPVKEPVPV